jgi:hypothetical protein
MTNFVGKKITISPLQQQYIHNSIFQFYDVASLANNFPRGI